MRSLSIPARVVATLRGLVLPLIFVSATGIRAHAQTAPQTESPPSCTGVSTTPPAESARAAPASHPHSVTLSWNTAVPTSNSPRDAIKGYYVYRSLNSHAYPEKSRISQLPLPGTRCVDTSVEARKTYFYTVKSVSEAGKQSSSSVEIQAVVPFP
jgi:hypothetical protein